MAADNSIAVLSLSQNRTVARAIHDYIQPHKYGLGGVLEADPLSTPDLALALRVLEPRPQAVVVGRGYSDDEANQVRHVFSEFSKETGMDQGIVIKITDEVFDKVGKEGVPKWVLEQLQAYFRK